MLNKEMHDLEMKDSAQFLGKFVTLIFWTEVATVKYGQTKY